MTKATSSAPENEIDAQIREQLAVEAERLRKAVEADEKKRLKIVAERLAKQEDRS